MADIASTRQNTKPPDQEECDYLTNFDHSTSYFYGLPKVHKSTMISEAISQQNAEYINVYRPEDLTFRPIVGGPNSPTQRLSELLDLILKPLCRKVPSFIRDDLDFLQQLPESVEEGSLLVTFDVKNLYTNIPHDLGLEALKYWLGKYPDAIDSRFNQQFIIKAAELILKRNVFYFDNVFYIQKKGTAMGTRFAPTYATLVLGFLEEKLYEKMTDKYNTNFSEYLRENWKRFLDDCFIIWRHHTDLDEFVNDLNALHPAIEFTMNKSQEEIPFLDVLVKLAGTCVSTDLYCKPTDKHMYLNFHSCHPKHIKIYLSTLLLE